MAAPIILLAFLAMAIVDVQSIKEMMPRSMFSLEPTMTTVEVSEVIRKIETGRWMVTDAQVLCEHARLLCDEHFVPLDPVATGKIILKKIIWKKNLVKRNLLSIGGAQIIPWFRLASLQPGKSLELGTQQTSFPSNAFLNPQLLPFLPFNTENLPNVLSTLNIPSKSTLASSMMKTLKLCEGTHGDEFSRCVLSLDEMASFVVSKLGGKAYVKMATAWDAHATAQVLQSTMVANNVIVCHPLAFPYRVYFCHLLPKSALLVDVVMHTGDGNIIQTSAICHMDTSSLEPNQDAFAFLNIKPGQGEICHWLSYDDIAFVDDLMIALS